MQPDRIVSVAHLKKCKLWKGSAEQLSYMYGGLHLSELKQRITMLQSCDDRTPEENEYLTACLHTLEKVTSHLDWK